MMHEKLLKIADRLIERANAYEEVFGDDQRGFVASPSYSIASTLREIAYQIRAELSAPDEET